MAEVYLSLGSNIDDRMAFLAKAESMLNAHADIKMTQNSKIYETEPWPKEGEHGQKWFLNQVIKIETDLSPQDLVAEMEKIEKELGRTEKHHLGPREIDIDILLYDDQIIDTPELTIPHRHIEDRQFVLVPLVEIAPDLIDPMTQRSFKNILAETKEKDDHKVTPFL